MLVILVIKALRLELLLSRKCDNKSYSTENPQVCR